MTEIVQLQSAASTKYEAMLYLRGAEHWSVWAEFEAMLPALRFAIDMSLEDDVRLVVIKVMKTEKLFMYESGQWIGTVEVLH